MYPEITPKNQHEQNNFLKNPRIYIEAKLELLKEANHPLITALNDSVIKNNLKDSDFFLFLSYYAVAKLVVLENEKITSCKKSTIERAFLKNLV